LSGKGRKTDHFYKFITLAYDDIERRWIYQNEYGRLWITMRNTCVGKRYWCSFV